MESLVAGSSRLPLTGKIVVDANGLMELVDRIRTSMPEDLEEAQQIIDKREGVINQAIMDARRLKSSAEQESKTRVTETEVVKGAHRRAEELMSEAQRRAEKSLADAQRQADLMHQDADQYALEVLSKLESQLSALLSSARRGIEQMESAKAA